MIARIIEFSARNRLLMVLLIVAIVAGGVWALNTTPLDAIPDLSDVQVIVYTEWADQSPNLVEDQVTYSIVTQLLSAPRVKAVRGNSFFGFSLVSVIFKDGTDLYWGRSRVLEYLSGMAGKLPQNVAPQLGPDATGVGWGLQYVLIDRSGKHNLAQLRSLQDWNVQYQLRAVPGVAEVASLGGFVKQYQVTVDPDKLLAYGVAAHHVVERHGFRRDEADRRPDGGWHRHLVHPRTAHLPGGLHHLEVVGRGAANDRAAGNAGAGSTSLTSCHR